jgi:hypothetical protein
LKLLLDLIPLNILALIAILLHERGLLDPLLLHFGRNIDYNFLFAIAALLFMTLSWELVKATILAPKGSGSWIDFIASFAFLIGLIVYAVKDYYKDGFFPGLDYMLLLEAQTLDVIVGFILALSNARRDLNLGN